MKKIVIIFVALAVLVVGIAVASSIYFQRERERQKEQVRENLEYSREMDRLHDLVNDPRNPINQHPAPQGSTLCIPRDGKKCPAQIGQPAP
jgi:hypothetical protein